MTDLPTQGSFEQTETIQIKDDVSNLIFTPQDQMEFIKAGVTVLTSEDRSNPNQVRFENTYHKVDNLFKENFFSRKMFIQEATTTRLKLNIRSCI